MDAKDAEFLKRRRATFRIEANINNADTIRDDQTEAGILADVVFGTRGLQRDATQSWLRAVTGIGAEYLKGITRDRVIILDAGKILGDESIIIHEEEEHGV